MSYHCKPCRFIFFRIIIWSICLCIYIYIYIYICIFLYTYIQTHIHTCVRRCGKIYIELHKYEKYMYFTRTSTPENYICNYIHKYINNYFFLLFFWVVKNQPDQCQGYLICSWNTLNTNEKIKQYSKYIKIH